MANGSAVVGGKRSFAFISSSEGAADAGAPMEAKRARETLLSSCYSIEGSSAKPNQDRSFSVSYAAADFNFAHAQTAVKDLVKVLQQLIEKLEIFSGATFTGIITAQKRALLFNIGDSKSCIAKVAADDSVKIICETVEHTFDHVFTPEKIFIYAFYFSEGCFFDGNDFKDAEGKAYVHLELYRPKFRKVNQATSLQLGERINIEDLTEKDEMIIVDTAHMALEDKKEFLQKLSKKVIVPPPGTHPFFDPSYYKLKMYLDKFTNLAMTSALGDPWPMVGHDVDFMQIDLEFGKYLMAALTDGVTDVCNIFGACDARMPLAKMLESSYAEGADLARSVCEYAVELWGQGFAGYKDDISASILVHEVLDKKDALVHLNFVSDGHGDRGHLVAALVKSFMQHLWWPYLKFLAKPCVEQLNVFLENITAEVFFEFLLENHEMLIDYSKEIFREIMSTWILDVGVAEVVVPMFVHAQEDAISPATSVESAGVG